MRQADISTALIDRQQLSANRLSVSNPLRFGMDRAKARAATRRTVFRAVKDKYGSNKAISEALSEGLREEFSPSYVSQLLNGHRNIGDDVAEKIERALSLPSGYLDDEKNSKADISPCLDNVIPGPDIRGKVPVIS